MALYSTLGHIQQFTLCEEGKIRWCLFTNANGIMMWRGLQCNVKRRNKGAIKRVEYFLVLIYALADMHTSIVYKLRKMRAFQKVRTIKILY